MYSVSLHMLMMTTEIASPGLLTTATGYTLDSDPSVRWFHMSDDKFIIHIYFSALICSDLLALLL